MENKHSLQSPIDRLLDIMAQLRDPVSGCPWDLKQDYKSISPYTLEEVHELVDCIEREDFEEMKHELGDVMFQVVFYAQLAKEEGRFDFSDVVDGISEKLIRRHPHVFASADADIDSEEVKRQWETIKQQERNQKQMLSQMDDIPAALSALQRARKVQGRAANIGFDWQSAAEVFTKLDEELDELKQAFAQNQAKAIDEELGDLMFTVVNLSRKLDREPEQILRQANRKFEQRFRLMEQSVPTGLDSLSAEQLEALWQQAKAQDQS